MRDEAYGDYQPPEREFRKLKKFKYTRNLYLNLIHPVVLVLLAIGIAVLGFFNEPEMQRVALILFILVLLIERLNLIITVNELKKHR